LEAVRQQSATSSSTENAVDARVAAMASVDGMERRRKEQEPIDGAKGGGELEQAVRSGLGMLCGRRGRSL